MKRLLISMLMIIAFVPSLLGSSISKQMMTPEENATISATVSWRKEIESSTTKFVGFSDGIPIPEDDWGSGWWPSYNLTNELSNDIKLTTDDENPDEIKGTLGAVTTPYIWFFNEEGSRWNPTEKCKITVSIKKMTSDQYTSGLDWSLVLAPNGKTGALGAALETDSNSSAVIFDGGTTENGNREISSDDFAYWSMSIETDPIPVGVGSGTVFSGNIIVEIGAGT